ncbi:Predicted N-formylglutamate amidohydrolase [Sphingomonas laterariae]|uniref:Predicted N-formylglutamate amidohydrolase n=1 Tax=Edaphosphingomonas laterariae TaxID=861865 RepID=A0A239H5K2_9SPHN|nr:N-formylglutamate amidohydrolase [Sphingomonas laterariae]SNS76650.1 Predicted N-formylglutamate amidohydrolase [Sphingomonas laterariae]
MTGPETHEAWREVAGDPASGLLLIADHASNHVPADVDLGIDPAILTQHVAIDIGVDPLGRALCAALNCPGIFGGVSRLVADCNREEDKPNLVPIASDGHAIPGNDLDHAGRVARIDRFWRPYHARTSEIISDISPKLLISLHSFTPKLATSDEPRPWQIGILYNQDDRAARIAIPLLEAAGVVTGDNEPYSGKILNATMNRHGEGNGIAYLGIEVRQDLIGDDAGVARWAKILAPVIAETLTGLRDGA